MTTIVYDHNRGEVAIDSRLTMNSTIITDSADKTISGDNYVYFFTGDLPDFELLSTLEHNQKVDVIPCCSAILIKGKKVYSVIVNSEGFCAFCELKFNYAMGTGEDFALAALDYGATAKEAIEYASTKDIYTGGKVVVKTLNLVTRGE